jgi:hypothetical protein
MPAPTLMPLDITKEDREFLERWLRRSKTSQALATRSRIVMAAAEGKSNRAISRELCRCHDGNEVASMLSGAPVRWTVGRAKARLPEDNL